GGRVRDLPVLDGHARDDRLGRDVEPDPPRRERRLEGGAEARPDAARDAALRDPSREHAAPAPGGRDRAVPRPGLLPGGRDGRRPRRLRRRPLPRPTRPRQCADQAVGRMTVELPGIEGGTLPPEGVRTMFDRIAPVYDVMNRVMTAGLDQRWR